DAGHYPNALGGHTHGLVYRRQHAHVGDSQAHVVPLRAVSGAGQLHSCSLCATAPRAGRICRGNVAGTGGARMKRLRVLHVTPDLVPYGLENMIAGLVRTLDRDIFESGIVSMYPEQAGGLEPELRAQG